MARVKVDTLYGTLGLLILQVLSEDSLHGLEIQRRIQGATGNSVTVEGGALYPALHRLEKDGYLEAHWGKSPKGRRAKFYSLTPQGRRNLHEKTENWLAHARAVFQILGVSPDWAVK
ncbi:MAG: PadR family transcriptional regulator [Gemmatimonadota bacterium]|jgi:transcriptional regulator